MMGLVARLVGLKSRYYTLDSFPHLPYRNVKKQVQKSELDFLHQLNTRIPCFQYITVVCWCITSICSCRSNFFFFNWCR